MSGKTLDPRQIADIEARLKALPEPDLTDPDNPEWTAEDFARARGPESLSPAELAAFPNTRPRGRPKAEQTKTNISIRLDAELLAHLKARGKGWQTEVNDQLLKLKAEGKL